MLQFGIGGDTWKWTIRVIVPGVVLLVISKVLIPWLKLDHIFRLDMLHVILLTALLAMAQKGRLKAGYVEVGMPMASMTNEIVKEEGPSPSLGRSIVSPIHGDTILDIVKKFMAYADEVENERWIHVVGQASSFDMSAGYPIPTNILTIPNESIENEYTWTTTLQVMRKIDADLCFKVYCVVDNTPASCFHILSDVTQRKRWDIMCELGKIVEEIDKCTRIIYIQTKGIWPTAPRDLVLLSFRARLTDGRLINVTKSVVHPACPDRAAENIVRMETGIAGQVCAPIPGHPDKCYVMQIADGNPGGWIPKSVIQYVATKAVPQSFRAVNSLMRGLPADYDIYVFPHISETLDLIVTEGSSEGNESRETYEKPSIHPTSTPDLESLKIELNSIQNKLVGLEKTLQMANYKPTPMSRMLGFWRGCLLYAVPFIVCGTCFIVASNVLKRH